MLSAPEVCDEIKKLSKVDLDVWVQPQYTLPQLGLAVDPDCRIVVTIGERLFHVHRYERLGGDWVPAMYFASVPVKRLDFLTEMLEKLSKSDWGGTSK